LAVLTVLITRDHSSCEQAVRHRTYVLNGRPGNVVAGASPLVLSSVC
jgi:hypothetical protein